MKQYILEACIDSAESAVEAVKGGADRLELCANLIIGGTTPEQALYEKVRELADTRIHVLIRPRYGDFLYTEHEFAIVARSVALYRELGADGVVVGCLLPDGSLDTERMKALREAAGPMSMTLHRAFDMCRDPYEALEQAKDLGIGTILTSGQKNGCMEGRELIAGLVRESGGKVDIMAGGGVDASVIRQMIPATRASSYHMSGKTVLDSGMACRRQEVSMGVPGLGEYEIFRTAREKIQEARRVLDEAAGLAGEWNRGKDRDEI
ncbi:MAG: copper homeostasis protein CutC [Lachnospiraceae bacterium]|nr:copper homeostasis protein CutC [uncultured Acetatifactor sp.]MCI8543193.1 copper homeostasis protein CutC [Lachnospiraceae bacterium]